MRRAKKLIVLGFVGLLLFGFGIDQLVRQKVWSRTQQEWVAISPQRAVVQGSISIALGTLALGLAFFAHRQD